MENLPNREHFKDPLKWLLALGSETVARPVLQLVRAYYAKAPPTNPTSWKKGLLIGADHIGDILYRTSSLGKLREAFPQCQWDWLVRRPADQILVDNPFIRKTLVPSSQCSRADLVRQVKDEGYDVALCYDVGAYINPLRLALEAGIPNRIGYTHKGFSAWVTHSVTFRPRQPFPGYFRDLVADLAHQLPDWPLRPQVYPSDEDENAALAFLEQNGLTDHPALVACFVTSRQPPLGVWPIESFIEVMENLSAYSGVQLVLCGAPGDHAVLEACQRRLPASTVINAGHLSLLALTSFLRRCRAVLSADSGPRHLANAVNTPVVFVRNPLSNPIETGVYCLTEHDCADIASEDRVLFVTDSLLKLIGNR